MIFQIEPGETLEKPVALYLDLWHGKCRDGYLIKQGDTKKSVFTLKGTYKNYIRL
jgi:hypothetical protein